MYAKRKHLRETDTKNKSRFHGDTELIAHR